MTRTRTHFDNELNQLNIELIDMGTLVEIAIDKAIHALNEKMLSWHKKRLSLTINRQTRTQNRATLH